MELAGAAAVVSDVSLTPPMKPASACRRHAQIVREVPATSGHSAKPSPTGSIAICGTRGVLFPTADNAMPPAQVPEPPSYRFTQISLTEACVCTQIAAPRPEGESATLGNIDVSSDPPLAMSIASPQPADLENLRANTETLPLVRRPQTATPLPSGS